MNELYTIYSILWTYAAYIFSIRHVAHISEIKIFTNIS